MNFLISYICFLLLSFSLLFSHSNRCNQSFLKIRSRPELSHTYTSQEENFQIHYDIEGVNAPSLADQDNDGVPDYVQLVSEIAEDSRNMLVNMMGYLQEPDDDDGLYDIFILNQSAWGWNVVEDSNTGISYVKIDNDYNGNNFESEYCLNNLDKMRISVAHEYFHAIQRAYRPNPITDHDFFLEMSAMWFEDLMVPECNDYLSFVDALSYSIFNNPLQSFDGSDLTSSQSQSNYGYSMALFLHYLVSLDKSIENSFNSITVRNIWESYSTGISARDAIVGIVENEIGDSFATIWSDFISRNMFCGVFNYFNQDIYYYSDQQYIEPISIETSDYIFTDENQLYVSDIKPYSANILAIGIMDDMLIESYLSDFEKYSGYYSVLGNSVAHDKINDSLL